MDNDMIYRGGGHLRMDNDVIYNPDIHHRKSIRLDGYDYSDAGAYFISVVAQGRLCLFGSVVDGELRLNEAGKMVRRVWDGMPDRFPLINMDEFVVMPNHVHGVIFIRQPAPTTGATSRAPAGVEGTHKRWEGTHKGGEGTHKGGEGTHKGCPYVGGGGWCVQICDHGRIC